MYSVIRIEPKDLVFEIDFTKGRTFAALVTPIMGTDNVTQVISSGKLYGVYIWITERNRHHLAILADMLVHNFMFEHVDIEVGKPVSGLRKNVSDRQNVSVYEFAREDFVQAFINETLKTL